MGKSLSYIYHNNTIIFIILYSLVIHHHLLKMNFKNSFMNIYLSSPFLPFIDDEKQFFLMRKKILGQPTPRQSQVALSAATARH